MMPSPQKSFLHCFEHGISSLRFPKSRCSPVSMTPLPQTADGFGGATGAVGEAVAAAPPAAAAAVPPPPPAVRNRHMSVHAAVPGGSHSSVPATMESPQRVAHELGVPVQVKPLSSVQVALQPSAAVTLPSSQTSEPVSKPSPQTGMQVLGVPAQAYPVSTAQAAEQPSPAVTLLSSQVSPASTSPSPHVSAQTLGSPTHAYPLSTVQVA